MKDSECNTSSQNIVDIWLHCYLILKIFACNLSFVRKSIVFPGFREGISTNQIVLHQTLIINFKLVINHEINQSKTNSASPRHALLIFARLFLSLASIHIFACLTISATFYCVMTQV